MDAVQVLDARFERYAADLEGALSLAEKGPPEVHSDLLRAHARFWTIRGGQHIALRGIDRARALISGKSEPVRAGALEFIAAHVDACLGNPKSAADHAALLFEHARSATDSVDSLRLQAFAHLSRAISNQSDNVHLALEDHETAIHLARRARADRTLAIALGNRGMCLRELGETERALSSLRAALGVFREIGDHVHVANTIGEIAMTPEGRHPLDPVRLLWASRETAGWGDDQSTARLLITLLEGAGSESSTRVSTLLARVWSLLARVDSPELEARARALSDRYDESSSERLLCVTRNGSRFVLGRNEVDLRTRKALPLVLVALVQRRLEEPGAALPVDELFRLAWPNEKALPHSAAARVYMAVRALRALGLRDALVTNTRGYFIDANVEVRWDEI
jgi:tetratricopeptide (TPR) repeat protein